MSFDDKDGNTRNAVRIKWWADKALKLGDVILPQSIDIGDAAELPIPEYVPVYRSDNPPCFIGHYWLCGKPQPMTPKIACLDYSIAKNGKLVAYRWSGEQEILAENFTYV